RRGSLVYTFSESHGPQATLMNDTEKVAPGARLSEVFFLTALVLTAAAWAARNGLLPGESLRAAAIQGILWACMYIGLGRGYRTLALKNDGTKAQAVSRKLALCLILALISMHFCKLLLAPFLAPANWFAFSYLRYLLPLALILVWCSALIPAETRALYRAVNANPAVAPLAELTLLLISSAVLVSCADLTFQWLGQTAVETRLKVDVILPNSWATNVLILFSAYSLIFAATARVATALLTVSPLYAAFGIATLAKIKYMHS